MKNFICLVWLGFVALLLSACATPVAHQVELILDTEPSGAMIICDGTEIGMSPVDYSQKITLDEAQLKEMQEKFGGNIGLPKCKARWASGYEDYFSTTANHKEWRFQGQQQMQNNANITYDVKNYTITKTLKRPKGDGYNRDFLYGKRYNKVGFVYGNRNLVWNLTTNPIGAQIQCENGGGLKFRNKDELDKVLNTGILEMEKCKAVFISGYEQEFKSSINIDYEAISALTHQTISRPNTQGYAEDMKWALELEKKAILEAHEMARTQAAQAQAAAQQRAAAAAEAQARAAQQQAQAAQQRLQGIDRSLRGIDNTLRSW